MADESQLKLDPRMLWRMPSFGLPAAAPASNMHEDDDALVFTLDVAGMDPNTIDLNVAGGMLALLGKRTILRTLGAPMESMVSQSFVLPEGLDVDRAAAVLHNGVLRVTVPKIKQPVRLPQAARTIQPTELKQDPNYAAFLADAGELQQKFAGQIVAYVDGKRIAEGRDAQELAGNIPEALRHREMLITDVSPRSIRFRRPARVRK